MVAQKLQRKDAKEQRPQRKNFTADKRRSTQIYFGQNFRILSAFICVYLRLIFFPRIFALQFCVFALILLSLSCSTKPTDMRTLVPADSLVYLEANDLAHALQPIIDSRPFSEVAKSKPDFSALKGVQLAIAVSGFETSEEKVNDEQSIGRVQPRFVAIADTHAFNFQAVGFAEQKLGSFVAKLYDSEPALEKSEKNGGKYFTWTATDKRKAYALVIDSLIYFGNDKSAIEKCLAVKRGETDSIIKTGKIKPADQQTLASGYVSPDGIAQIANIIGLKFASETSEDSEVQSAIAGILPKLLRNSITEISWTATKQEQGIGVVDRYIVSMPPDIAGLLNETIASKSTVDIFNSGLIFVPDVAESVTIYNLENARVAWRSLLLTAQKQVDPIGQKIISEFSGVFLEPYGIKDPEGFLDSITGTVTSVRFRGADENRVLIAAVNPFQDHLLSTIQDHLLSTINPNQKTTDPSGTDIFLSADDNLAAVFLDNKIMIGDHESVFTCLAEKKNPSPKTLFSVVFPNHFTMSAATATTVGKDNDSASEIAAVLSTAQSVEANQNIEAKGLTIYTTETRFTKTGIERKTVSAFGLIGSIIAQLAQD
ncbi:MAG: hypothetical protein IPL32_10940 [Chloracidobacterium sp.]|nr:hypothetical protein [Chloracidobacterium sp.]